MLMSGAATVDVSWTNASTLPIALSGKPPYFGLDWTDASIFELFQAYPMAVLPKTFVPLAVGGAVAVLLVVGGGAWWMDKQHYEKTDNAFIAADKVSVAPQVDG